MTEIKLTEEQQKERFETKVKPFLEGYDKLCKDTGMQWMPVLNTSHPSKIEAAIVPVDKPLEDKKQHANT